MNRVLSNYPLSLPFRAALERSIGSFDPLVVSELRQVSFSRLLSRLVATTGDRLYVAFEDESSRALLPVLGMLAAATRVRELYAIDQHLAPQRLTRINSLRSALALLRESAAAARVLRRNRRDLRSLARTERIAARLSESRAVTYLNCNLWFGVRAGGSVGHVSGVVNALSDLEYHVRFFSAGGRLLVDDRAEHVPLEPPHILAVPFETTYYRFDRSCEAQIVRSLADESPPAFLYQRMSLGNYTGVRLSRQYGVPLVLEYNGSEAWVARNWGRPLRYHEDAVAAEDVCLRHAHVVVTVSEVLGRELEDRGVDRERIVVYPNGIDPAMFDPDAHSSSERRQLRESLGLDAEDVVATFIGTFGQWHGADVLARSIRCMLDEHQEFLEAHRLRFVLVGDGMKMPVVRKVLAGAEQGPYVRLVGLVPQSDAPRYLAASDILLSPHVRNRDGSAFFGSPTKLFEYMAMARGIVASDLDQIGEVLQPAIRTDAPGVSEPGDDRIAVLVPPGDVDGLIEGIRLLAADGRLREALGRNARARALDRYTWRHHTQAILDGLHAVCGTRS